MANKDKLSNSGIYKISCDNCNKVYLGQTGRNFKTRLKEHMRAFRLNYDYSNVAKHMLETGHICNNLEILHVEVKGFKLNALESYYIKNEIIGIPDGKICNYYQLMIVQNRLN